jgi:hypothetical protein
LFPRKFFKSDKDIRSKIAQTKPRNVRSGDRGTGFLAILFAALRLCGFAFILNRGLRHE